MTEGNGWEHWKQASVTELKDNMRAFKHRLADKLAEEEHLKKVLLEMEAELARRGDKAC